MFEHFGDPNSSPEADLLKAEMTEIIKWADSRSPRTLQTNLGPSEISSGCKRAIGMRMARIPVINEGADPWPAIVGTGIHMWLEQAVKGWAIAHRDHNWRTEVELPFTEQLTGHGDLFHVGRGWVVDHKSAGKDRMTEVIKQGPPEKYINQVNIYGLGYELLGYTVTKVGLVFYPRAGRLKDVVAWVEDYDRARAFRSLDQLPIIEHQLIQLDVINNPHRWEQVDAKPSHDCGYCPYYNFRLSLEQGASDEGCPGK